MQEYVIIVAGGTGSRMKSDLPKQFIAINGLPVLMHTIRKFRSYSAAISIIVVLPENQFNVWKNLCTEYSFEDDYMLTAGGETRFHSVRNGLAKIAENNALVGVHDGVRPIVSKEIIANGFSNAAKYGTAVTSVTLKDSVRSIGQDGINNAVDRSLLRLIQTPQTFRADWMSDAFSRPYQDQFTDCASVLEAAGYPIYLIDGAYENIKITTPEDLALAEIYLEKKG